MAKSDILGHDEIIRLVDEFYTKVRADDILGFIFDDLAKVDWPSHLPIMYSFWQTIVFGDGEYRGSPLIPHAGLAMVTAMQREQFGRWLRLFHDTVDKLYEGEIAEFIKQRANDIASMMHCRINNIPYERVEPGEPVPA